MATSPPVNPTARGSIRRRAAMLMSGLVAASLIAVIAYTFFAMRTSLLHAGEARANAAAVQLAGIVGAPLPARLAEIQRLVDHPIVREALIHPSPETETAAKAHLKPLTTNAQQQQTIGLWTLNGTRTVGMR